MAIAALGVLAVVAGLSLRSVIKARDVAESRQKEAVARADELTLTQARTSLERDPNAAVTWLMSLSPSFDRWRAARMIAADAEARGLATVLRGHTGAVNHLAISPDGKTLISVGDDARLQVWDIEGGSARSLAGHTDEIYRAVFLPHGRSLVTSSKDRTVRLWDIAGGTSRCGASGSRPTVGPSHR